MASERQALSEPRVCIPRQVHLGKLNCQRLFALNLEFPPCGCEAHCDLATGLNLAAEDEAKIETNWKELYSHPKEDKK